ncbi:MAG: chemotaxis protein CheY [Mycobacterium sp.]|jgi:CheY-like chemotaxis protein|nr:chemotaxis protein CheY [Mycobacterium sp.]
MRCLIVDDSADFRDAATDMLERAGIDDFTLVDVELNGESGFDVVEQLHAEDGPAPSTILISTHSEQDYAEMIAASPALGFLAKFALSPAAIRGLLGH